MDKMRGRFISDVDHRLVEFYSLEEFKSKWLADGHTEQELESIEFVENEVRETGKYRLIGRIDNE